MNKASKANKNKRRAILGWCAVFLFSALVLEKSTERFFYDFRLKYFLKDRAPSPDVVFIDFDDPSLKQLAESFGRWPVTRMAYYTLFEGLKNMGPKMIIFDILFTEPQLTGEGDKLFSESTANSKETLPVSQSVLLTGDPSRKLKAGETAIALSSKVSERLAIKTNGTNSYSDSFQDYLAPIDSLIDGSAALHVVNAQPEDDGILRSLPVLFQYDPVNNSDLGLVSLSLRGLLAFKPELASDPQQLAKAIGPIGANGQRPLYFYPPNRSFKQFSFAQIINASQMLHANPNMDPADLGKASGVNIEDIEGRVLIVGSSAVGASDLKTTSLEKGFPGTLVHATAISNMIMGEHISTPVPKWSAFVLASLLSALIYAAMFLSSKAVIRFGTPLVVLVVWFALCAAGFKTLGWMIPMGLPIACALLAFIDCLGYLVLVEGRERKKMQGTLSKYLPPAVIEQMIESGQDLQAEVGKKEELSILFSDIRGFTTMSEKYPAEQIVAVLNDYLGSMTEVVFRSQGTLDKFIGDAIMAFWGAPVSDPLHAQHAVSCALDMRTELKAIQEKLKAKGTAMTLEIGIGINTGPVIVGNIGSEKKLDYTVIGDNVNLASRLEGLTKQYHVELIIGERTYELLGSAVRSRIVDRVRVKGKANAVSIYEPLKNNELVEQFNAAWDLYQKGNFAKAIDAFQACQRLEVSDESLSKLYVERCQELMTLKPALETWDGTFTATSK